MESFDASQGSEAQPIEQLNFDLLRALLEARQGASPTVRALAAVRTRIAEDATATRVALFTGQDAGERETARLGAFRPRTAGDAVPADGERHV